MSWKTLPKRLKRSLLQVYASRLVAEMTPERREVVERSLMRGNDLADIAEDMGKSLCWVVAERQAALEFLRSKVK